MRTRPLRVLALSSAFLVAGCAAVAPDEDGVQTAESLSYPNELRGFVSTEARPADVTGWDYNRCVPDPIGQVMRLRQRGDVLGYNMGAGYPDVNEDPDHWQGVQRLGIGNRRFMALGSMNPDGANLAIVQMGSRNATGARFRGNRMSTSTQDWNVGPAASDAIVQHVLINSTYRHPGGMQTLGRYLFVPLEQGPGNARIYNYDVGGLAEGVPCDPATGAGCPQKKWGFVASTNMAAVAATTKLSDGRYMMLTAQGDSNVLEFYLSKPGRHISDPNVFGTSDEWGKYEAKFDRESYPEFRSYYQNMNLLTACPGAGYETGQIYLLGTTKDDGTDYVELFELSMVPGTDPAYPETDHTVHMHKVASRVLSCHADSSPRECDFEAAAGSYVDPDGRLLVYGAEHDNDGPGGSVKMMEFRPTDHLDDPNVPGTTGSCLGLDDAFVELYDGPLSSVVGPTTAVPGMQNGLFVEYRDRAKRNYSHFGTAFGMNDAVWAVRYCIPPGYKYRLFKDSGYSGATATLRGDATIAGVGDPSNGVIRGYNFAVLPIFSNPGGWSSGCFMTATGSTCL